MSWSISKINLIDCLLLLWIKVGIHHSFFYLFFLLLFFLLFFLLITADYLFGLIAIHTFELLFSQSHAYTFNGVISILKRLLLSFLRSNLLDLLLLWISLILFLIIGAISFLGVFKWISQVFLLGFESLFLLFLGLLFLGFLSSDFLLLLPLFFRLNFLFFLRDSLSFGELKLLSKRHVIEILISWLFLIFFGSIYFLFVIFLLV